MISATEHSYPSTAYKRVILRQTVAVVFVSELADDADVAGAIGDGNGGEAHTVEGIVFDHGVMGHILMGEGIEHDKYLINSLNSCSG